MAQQKFPSAGDYSPNYENLFRRVLNNLSIIMTGKLNNTGEITVTANAASTDVPLSVGQLTNTTVITFMPTTSNAALEIGAGTMYVSTINASSAASGGLAAYSFRIVHANNAQTDRTFKYSLLG